MKRIKLDIKEIENQWQIVCAWRFDTTISAEKYLDALEKLIKLEKAEQTQNGMKYDNSNKNK